MAWIEAHQELETHPKLLRFAALIKVDQVTALGHLITLWWWVIKYAENGVLDRFDASELAAAARFKGTPNEFINALMQSKLLDDTPLRVHDWIRYSGRWLRNKYAGTSRGWLVKTWRIYGLKYGEVGPTDNQHATNRKPTRNQQKSKPLPNLTIPNLTIPLLPTGNGDESLNKSKGDKVQKPETDIQKIVRGWKLLTSVPTEGAESQAWDRVHFPRMAKSAKSLLDLFGGWEPATDAMEYVYMNLTAKKLSCTLETIVKHSDLYREYKDGRIPK